MSMEALRSRFLSRPKVEVVRGPDGETESVFVRFQVAHVLPVRTIHPNGDHLVFFNLDDQGLPVSIVLHEPVEGLALSRFVLKTFLGPDGQHRVERQVRNYFLTEPHVIDRILGSLQEAKKKLEKVTA